MKNSMIHLFVFMLLVSCKPDLTGQLTGKQNRLDYDPLKAPYQMEIVPGGQMTLGPGDELEYELANSNKRITISSFYMDRYEVTNHQWRRFVADVVDTFAVWKPDFIDSLFIPDTTVWMKDFTHHMHDPMVRHYYQHPAFDEYPVVGIKWRAAQLYCEWRSKKLRMYQEGIVKKSATDPKFRLPTAAEWQWAAMGAKDLREYPWGGPYASDSKGRIMANFKPGRGDYIRDGYYYTAPVGSYPANDLGLYDMAGNVSEMVLDDFSSGWEMDIWDLNPVLNNGSEFKIAKGGSWKDIGRATKVYTKQRIHVDSSTSYIGFRTVMPMLR